MLSEFIVKGLSKTKNNNNNIEIRNENININKEIKKEVKVYRVTIETLKN